MNDTLTTTETELTPMEELQGAGARDDCLVTIYSSDPHQLGRRHLLSRETIELGRGPENHIVLGSDIVSRRHCRLEYRGTHWYMVDLRSTNGTYINDELVDEYQLRPGDHIKIGDTILKYLSGSDVEGQYHETIYRMTIVDALTEVHNKRYLMDALEREIPRARRHRRPLSLVMFDIDHFKKINDDFGHLAGDSVLKELAGRMLARIRPDDVLGRYGGEEFIVILPETASDEAVSIADGLRKAIGDDMFYFEGQGISVSVSAGVAELDRRWDTFSFLKAADERLYLAKDAGRNQVYS